MDSKANQLAPIDNFDEAYILGQYAHESAFRSTTFPKLLSWMQVRIDVQGSELIDPIPPGTESKPAVIPAGPEDKKGKFEPEPGFYEGFPEVTSDNRYYFYWNKADWTLIDMGPIPTSPLSHEVNSEDDKAVTPKAVKDYSLEKTTQRILPEGQVFLPFDRPDVANIPLLDEDDNLTGYIKHTTVPNDEFEYSLIDRPDIEFAVTDKDGNLIYFLPKSNISPNPGQEVVKNFDRPDLGYTVIDVNSLIVESRTKEKQVGYDNVAFFNPSEKPAFNVATDVWGRNYSQVISKYDEFLPYGTKQVIGKSSATGKDIVAYRFKSSNKPKGKILFTSGTHAGEKMYVFGIYEIAKDFILNSYSNPTLQWIRENFELIFVPVVSPDSIGFPERLNGTRTIPETKPFKASYSSDGTTMTISYNAADFPIENKNLNPSNYFKPITRAGDKRYVTIWSTDDAINVPKNVYSYSYVNGNTVTIAAPTPNIVSGEVFIQVWTDPNRNCDNSNGIWDMYIQSSTIQQLDDLTSYAIYDHKGTSPWSLQEMTSIRDFIWSEDIDIIIDGHCPPENNYVRTGQNVLVGDTESFIESLSSFSALFNNDPLSQNIDKFENTVYPAMYNCVGNRPCFIIEWGSGLTSATIQQVTDAVRWAYMVLIATIKNSLVNNLK